MSDLTPEQRKWIEDAFDGSREGISSSQLFVVGFSGKKDDAVQCLQLGMAIMMNKPIIVLADDATPIPKTLERVAVRVARTDLHDAKKIAKIMAEAVKGWEEKDA
jgi:hypothetical protein